MGKTVAIGALLLLVVIAVIGWLASGDHDTTDVAESPAPSDQQVAPSASPPVPAQATSAQRAYLEHLVNLSHQVSDATRELSRLFAEARNDSALVQQHDWNTQVGANLDVLRETHNQVQTMTPPEDLGIIQGKAVESFGHANLAADSFARGIDTLDPALIEHGNHELQQARANITELATLVEEYRIAHGL